MAALMPGFGIVGRDLGHGIEDLGGEVEIALAGTKRIDAAHEQIDRVAAGCAPSLLDGFGDWLGRLGVTRGAELPVELVQHFGAHGRVASGTLRSMSDLSCLLGVEDGGGPLKSLANGGASSPSPSPPSGGAALMPASGVSSAAGAAKDGMAIIASQASISSVKWVPRGLRLMARR